MTVKLRLPTPGPSYDQRNEAETRREIELLLLKSVASSASAGAARRTVIFATGSLASGATESGSTNFGAPGQHLIMIESDVPARVRLYSASSVRDADLSRAVATPPDSGTGVFLDAVWNTTHVKYIAPPVFLYNADSPVADTIYYNITNLDSSTTPVTITATVISAEVGTLGLNPTDDSTVDGVVFNLSGGVNGQFLKLVGGVWTPADITASDIISGTIATARLGSGTADATKYLRGDQTWADLNAAHITSGTVATARLGSGTANNTKYLRGDQAWSDLDAGHITAGTVATARLGSGTADNTKFLRGDQTWAVPAGGGGGDGSIAQFNASAQPASPNAMDDEFETSSLDAKWNQRNSPTLSYADVQSCILVQAPQNSGDQVRFIMQTVPSAQSFKVRARMAISSHNGNFRSIGLYVNKATTTDKFTAIKLDYASGIKIQVSRWTNWTTFGSDVGTALNSANDDQIAGPWLNWHYFEVEYDHSITTLYFRYSGNGLVYRQLHSETVAAHLGSMAEIGIGVNTNDNVNGATYAIVDWFRRIS